MVFDFLFWKYLHTHTHTISIHHSHTHTHINNWLDVQYTPISTGIHGNFRHMVQPQKKITNHRISTEKNFLRCLTVVCNISAEFFISIPLFQSVMILWFSLLTPRPCLKGCIIASFSSVSVENMMIYTCTLNKFWHSGIKRLSSGFFF